MNISIKENTFKCRVCATPLSIQDGMKNKTFNMSFNGMFFILPNKGKQKFWMYECITSLDILFIDGDTITEVHNDCLPCDVIEACENYGGYGDHALELPGGTCQSLGIVSGDKIKIGLP